MGRLAWVESALAWIERIERSPWGRRMIGAVAALAWSAWAWIYTNVPPPFIIAVAICLLASVLYLQERLHRYLVIRLAPPIKIGVPGIAYGEVNVHFPLQVINTHQQNRVSLKFYLHVFAGDDSDEQYIAQMEPPAGFKANLGPQDDTSGQFDARLVGVKAPIKELANKWGRLYLRVIDELTGRRVEFPIPGGYPLGHYGMNRIWPLKRPKRTK